MFGEDPNIKGAWSSTLPFAKSASVYGAADFDTTQNARMSTEASDSTPAQLSFNAELSSSLYVDGSTIQCPALQVLASI